MSANILKDIKNHKIRTSLIIGLILILYIMVSWFIKVYPYINIKNITIEELDALNLDGYNKLMIVAHPDDETLWGGAHLLEDNYVVVCVTNRNNEVRRAEFETVMEKTNDIGLIMSYPDLIGGKKSKWTLWKGSISQDLETIINYKDWELIVTHNVDGEYGHIHHKMLHELVSTLYDNTDIEAQLYYFGKYYKAEDIPADLERISDENLQAKKTILYEYVNQLHVLKGFKHMIPYELWTEK